MPSQRSGPPIILSAALAATTGFVAIVGVMAGSAGNEDPAGLVIQVPVSRMAPGGGALNPAAGAVTLAGPATPAAETTVLGRSDTTAPTVATVTTTPAVTTAAPVAPVATQSTIVLQATPAAAAPAAPAPTAERTGERVVQLDTGVSNATTRAS